MRCELPTGNLHTFYCIIPDKALRALCSVQGRQWNEHITDASHWRACDARGIGFPREGIIKEDRQAENDWVDGIAIEQEIVVVLVQLVALARSSGRFRRRPEYSI